MGRRRILHTKAAYIAAEAKQKNAKVYQIPEELKVKAATGIETVLNQLKLTASAEVLSLTGNRDLSENTRKAYKKHFNASPEITKAFSWYQS